MAEIDVNLSLAAASLDNNYSMPEIFEDTHDARFEIVEGRHPIADKIFRTKGISFTSNSCRMPPNMYIVTGPNMGGKSTFLKQNALIAIMAQAGSFVPATSVKLGLIDAIFTRVGASDDLSRDKSTFLIEMEETAVILREATRNSLVIMDEIGRGTSHSEGISIAYGTIKYLQDVIRCKCLFATHYADLSRRILHHDVGYYKTSVVKVNGELLIVPKVVPGISNSSYGIHVARLAGLPDSVIETAREYFVQISRENQT